MLTMYKYKLFLKTVMAGIRYITIYKTKLYEGHASFEHVVNIPQQYLHPSERKITRKICIGSYVILGKRKVRRYT